MPLDVPHLLTPRATPDGTVSWEEERPELGRLIREGDGRTGWLGDPRLSLHLNVTFARDEDEQAKLPPHKRGLPRWEVWRDHEQVDATMVGCCIAQRIDGIQLTRQLAAHDSRVHDIAQEMLDAREAHAKQSKKDLEAVTDEHGDKLAWALGKDLGLPAPSGRMFRFGGGE